MKVKKNAVIIDIEFTGLDRYIKDNEIIQLKMLNMKNKKRTIRNFNSLKEISAYPRLCHKVVRYTAEPLFSKDIFEEMLREIEAENTSKFWGFGTTEDMKMLSKYGIGITINDIRNHYQKNKEVALKMAVEGSGLEETYFLVTGRYPPKASHASFSELLLIKKLFEKMEKFEAEEFMEVMPWGHCSGMPISDYVTEYRRAADGYRFNNSDDLSYSLSAAIAELEGYDDEDYDDSNW